MGGYRKRGSKTGLWGLIGIAVLAAISYALIGGWFSNDRDPDSPAQIPGDAIAPAVGADPTGMAVYNKACVACHGTGVANAPKLGDQAAWQPRMAQGSDRLLETSIAGKGAMPPRGTCADCSDDDLKAAVEYMLVQVGYEPAASPRTGDTP
ncbi:c-type cytochrome [Candidatus Thiosymbion oneisti]|uniref:c-type cytochrome n=1 Tax=Candidatus Thiosymbion oneisti TaxID=589554 RepID=UPI001A9C4065|nr:c-type cytochrome [Candidatus Thiosymbion oneisti]